MTPSDRIRTMMLKSVEEKDNLRSDRNCMNSMKWSLRYISSCVIFCFYSVPLFFVWSAWSWRSWRRGRRGRPGRHGRQQRFEQGEKGEVIGHHERAGDLPGGPGFDHRRCQRPTKYESVESRHRRRPSNAWARWRLHPSNHYETGSKPKTPLNYQPRYRTFATAKVQRTPVCIPLPCFYS